MKLFGPESGARLAYGSIGRTAVEAVLALTTGLLLARFAWVIVAPGNAAGAFQAPPLPALADASSAPSSLSLLTQTDPFQAASPDMAQAAIPTSLNLQIAGLRWSDGEAGTSSAVLILPDNTQKRVAAGDQIISGAILESVAADRVFLRFNGQLQELLLKDPNKPLFAASSNESGAPAPTTSAPQTDQGQTATSTPQTVTPALLMTDIDMQPELRNGAVTGYRLSPRGQGHFQAAGLETGDLVLRVNGASLEGMGPDAIQAAVMSSDVIALDVVRRGAIVRLRLSPDSGLSQ
ncbi:general secretion pathway protein C [Hyphomonas neptunium ATCC 15444]|uniref:General secretion pathway protein C n=2 Tax=Hyphomonas TaxID=85 RepID=Q0C128_HYPNA|nr:MULTISPECIES: type II secretion system protein N [Hyphomonas]ABI78703.1 general secretion pathway protein C [Hyphomonas neptunium ATCC 15444]KCZ95020.1 general secretion pathway protein C [Hyphomonas hirschiana VP5]